MTHQPIVQVDAFTEHAFAGNPAAVCILAAPRSDHWMRNVAMEMNLSETAFLVRDGEAYRLRWFTPTVEMDLCGHATLASAHVLWETGELRADEPAVFDTRSGRLTARREDGWIVMDFPSQPGRPAEPPPGLLEAVGVTPCAVLYNAADYLIEVEAAEQVRALTPDLARLAVMPMRGVVVTARADQEPFDFVSRFFAPAAGVNEDPATGSTHCALAPYWASKLGRTVLNAYQASPRGGVLRVEVKNDRVLIAGKAVTVLRGELIGD